MEMIILVGHGSPKKDANQMEYAGKILHGMLHPGCASRCVRVAYLQFESPGLAEVVEEAAKANPRRIIIQPFFLSRGVHVSKDIPAVIKEAEARYPQIEFICSEPLGVSEGILRAAKERIEEAAGPLRPQTIEAESLKRIEEEISLADVPAPMRPVVGRVIHATADFEYKNALLFHPEAVSAGVRAIRAGSDIAADVEMVRAGINKAALGRFGGKVACGITAVEGEDPTRTKAERGFVLAMGENTGIAVIGNAPTALFSCIKMMNEGAVMPELVIGVPVGFVRAVESKALLSAQGFPYITSAGRKGGSAVAAAIVNALLKIAGQQAI